MAPVSSSTLSYAGEGPGITGTFVAPYLVRLLVADQPSVDSLRTSIAEVSQVEIGRGDTFAHERSHDGSEARLRIEIPDGWMSGRHALLSLEEGQWRVQDCGSKNGCYLNGVRTVEARLRDGDIVHTGNTSFLFRSQVERSHLDPADLDAASLRGGAVAGQTLSVPLAHTMRDLAQVATSGVSVVLGGETGTGKEVSARYVHACSSRSGAFVAVNCGALPSNLVESELFGHRKGAFSGAQSDRVGLVQASDGGTLFLDEVAELSLEAQVKLLRVLQEREVVPLGATRPIPLDLRVVAATHADLESLVAEGRFRSDLYSRLAGVRFCMPALRERREDFGLLISALLRRNAPGREMRFEREALWALALYDWPRNIRELEQALVAAVAWAGQGVIGLRHLPPEVAAVLAPAERSEDDQLCAQLKAALRAHQGNVSATAREMGKARVQIRRWCKRFGIDPSSYR